MRTFRENGSARRLLASTLRPLYVALRDGVVGVVERRNGIRTSGTVDLVELGVDGPGRMWYKPAPWLTLRRAMPPTSVGPTDVFVDLGSGMGRVVYQAAMHYPFARVIGVEISPELHRIAQSNIVRNRHRLRCSNVELVCRDVLDYPIPDDTTVAFIFNSFQGKLFDTVIERLLASVDRSPRPFRLIYANPVEHHRLIATGRFRLVKQLSGMRPDPAWARSNATYVYTVSRGGGC